MSAEFCDTQWWYSDIGTLCLWCLLLYVDVIWYDFVLCRAIYTDFINKYEHLVEMVVPRSAK